jgi:quercetin dioxygenase-like cupin family protein
MAGMTIHIALESTIHIVGIRSQTGRHKHPCPVIGYIAEGSAVLQIEGQRPQQLPTGSAFYEPADVIITRFDNASATAPMKFIAQYLLDGDQALIEML